MGAFWKITKSNNEVYFERGMKQMQDLDALAWDWLKTKGPMHFSRLHFSTHAKWDSMDNDMYEILNGIIIEARFKHIFIMLKEI